MSEKSVQEYVAKDYVAKRKPEFWEEVKVFGSEPILDGDIIILPIIFSLKTFHMKYPIYWCEFIFLEWQKAFHCMPMPIGSFLSKTKIKNNVFSYMLFILPYKRANNLIIVFFPSFNYDCLNSEQFLDFFYHLYVIILKDANRADVFNTYYMITT